MNIQAWGITASRNLDGKKLSSNWSHSQLVSVFWNLGLALKNNKKRGMKFWINEETERNFWAFIESET